MNARDTLTAAAKHAQRSLAHFAMFLASVAAMVYLAASLESVLSAAGSWLAHRNQAGDVRSTSIIRTGCWAGAEDAYYDTKHDHYEGDPRAGIAGVMTFVAQNKLGGTPTRRFELAGQIDVTFDGHLVSIYEALERAEVDSIIYTNAPGALEAFTNADAIRRVLPVLERVETEYPLAAPHAKRYREHLMASRGYREAETLSPASETPTQAGMPDPQAGKLTSAAPEGRAPGSKWLRAASEQIGKFRKLGASALSAGAPRLDMDYIRLIQLAQSTYVVPERCSRLLRPLMNASDFWIASGGEEVWLNWLQMVAKMTRQRGVRFVFYVPPHLHVPSDQHESALGPHFVDLLRRVLSPYPHATVLDHSMRTSAFNQCDTIFFKRDGLPITLGYAFNLIGKLKQAELLLGDLSRLGLPGVPAHDVAPKSWWEVQTPRVQRRIDLMSQELGSVAAEEVLSPAVYLRSRRAADHIGSDRRE